jgi:hypothetical protein
MRAFTCSIFFILVLSACSPVFGAEAKLTVTATVEGSVCVVLGPDGQWKVQVANLPDPADHLVRFVKTQTTKTQNSRRPVKPSSSKLENNKNEQGAR